jgi:hypothetical protein
MSSFLRVRARADLGFVGPETHKSLRNRFIKKKIGTKVNIYLELEEKSQRTTSLKTDKYRNIVESRKVTYFLTNCLQNLYNTQLTEVQLPYFCKFYKKCDKVSTLLGPFTGLWKESVQERGPEA